ncbi:MAG: hypothetical protein P4L11_00890 [Geothrix sp.]|nr:hypothetical protein [Geothrix sp.]
MPSACLRPRRFLKVSVLLLLAGTFAVANLRRAILWDPGASGALRPVPGLTLQDETLAFTFGGVHRGPMPDLARQPRVCRIEAVYRLVAATDQAAAFNFIAPSADAVSARVNGREVAVTPSVFQEPPRLDRQGTPVAGPRYSLAFHGPLRAGPNEVAVAYSQTLGADEQGLAYFHRSRWRTFVGYEFWPVKEWVRVPGFKAELTLSVPRSPGLWETLFGPDLLLGVETRDRDGAAPPSPVAGSHLRTADRLVSRFTLAGDRLPDVLTVSATEK